MMAWLRSIRRLFMPSPTLAGYIAKQFSLRFLMMLGLIVVILQMLDLMATSDAILAGEGQSRGALWTYIMLRAPQLIDQFTPFAALLGVLLTVSGLRQTSELTVMRGTGLSPHRLVFPLTGVCIVIAVRSFWLQENVVGDASDRLKYWQQNDYAADLPPRPDVRSDIWLYEDERILHVGALNRSGSRVILDYVSVYALDAQNMVREARWADFAWYDDGRWRLFGVRRFDVETLQVSVEQSTPWELALTPEQLMTRNVDPAVTEIGDLRNVLGNMPGQSREADDLRTALLSRFSGPAATLVMPLLGTVAGAGSLRRGRGAARLLIGMALGFSYFVFENFMLAMGELGSVPAAIAAFSPFVFFSLLGLSLTFWSEE